MNDDKIRTAFRRLDRDVRATIRPAASLERIGRRRWGRLLLIPVAAAAVVALVVGAGALLLRGTEPLPPATSLPTDVTTPTPTTLPGTVTTVPNTDPDGPVVQPTAVAVGEILLASPDGVAVARDGLVVPIVDAPARVAVGDRSGGILYESGGDVYRLRANSAAPELLATSSELQDTAIVDDRPVVIFTRHRADDGADSVTGRAWYAPLDTEGEPVLIYESDGFEGSITRVSHGGGIFAVTLAAEGIEWFEFVDAAGSSVDVANPRPFEADSQEDRYTDQGVLSPDGSQLVFLQSDEPVLDVGDGIDVVLWDVAGGQERQRFPVGLAGEAADRTSYWFVRADSDGARLVLGRLDADRNALAPLEIGLADASLLELPAPGNPSIVGPAAPPPADPQAALVPAEGFGRGLLLATGERVVWYPDPADPLAEGREQVVWEFTDGELGLGDGRFAYDDGAGGVVSGGGQAPVRWLPPGARSADAVELAQPGDTFPLALHGVADIDGARRAFGTQFDGERVQLVTIRLDTGDIESIGAVDPAGGGIANLSFDGERFWVAGYERLDGQFCSRTWSIGPDGRFADVSGVPDRCTSDTLFEQARVSPDGRLVAYVEAGQAGTEPELGTIVRTGPIDLVVADTGGGEVARVRVGTDVQDVVLIHDFDGERIVVSRQSEEPALSQQALFVIDLDCSGCAGRIDTVAANGGLTGPAEPPTGFPTLEPLPGCSVDGTGGHAGEQSGLPEPVAATRQAILDAAERCDFAALDSLALDGEFSFHFDSGFPGMFRQSEDAGSPAVRLIARMLGFPYGTVDAGAETIYVWPEIATYESWDQVSVEEQNQLSFVYDFPEQRQFADFGAYVGLRVGITESGDWIFVAEGD